MSDDLFNPTSEHLAIRRAVRDFVESEVDPQADSHDASQTFNRPLFEALGTLGLLGVAVPERFGGLGMDATAAVIVHEELAASDPGLALSCLAHSVLFAANLARLGDDAQRARLLPDVCAGRRIAGMAMSEAGAGTDMLALGTRARRDGERYLLDGNKMWITNGYTDSGEAGDLFLVYARTSGRGPPGVSLFIVERAMPGFSLGQRIHHKLGMRASPTAELVLEACEVPVANRVGGEGRAIFDLAATFELERLTMAALGLGIARRCLEIMNRYASQRQSFGEPLRAFGQIQRHLAESYAEWMAGRSYVYRIASEIHPGAPSRALDADGAKLFCSTMAKQVADRAIQVLGASGYVCGSIVERMWRDARLLEIGGGTLEAHQRNITQALRRVDKLP